MKLPSCVAACCTTFLSDLFVLFRFFGSHVKFVLNWAFDIFAEFPTFVFSKTFNCHFASHVLADFATEKNCANYTDYFGGNDFRIYILGHLPRGRQRPSPQKDGSRASFHTFVRVVLLAYWRPSVISSFVLEFISYTLRLLY